MSDINDTIKEMQDLNDQLTKKLTEYKRLANEYRRLTQLQAETGIRIAETSTMIRIDDNPSLNPLLVSILQQLKIENLEILSDSILVIHSRNVPNQLKVSYSVIGGSITVHEDLSNEKLVEMDFVNFLKQKFNQK